MSGYSAVLAPVQYAPIGQNAMQMPGVVGQPQMGGFAPAVVSPAPTVSPQVIAGQPNCQVPAITVAQNQPCPDPNNSLQITKRVFLTVTSGLFVVDFGNAMQGGFGASEPGLTTAPPGPGSFVVTTDSVTTGVIRDITIAFDPFAADGEQMAAGLSNELLLSYGWSYSALLAGNITVENTPFPTVIPIASAIKNVGGIEAFWTQTTPQDQVYVSATQRATHAHAPAPIEIHLPVSSTFRVLLGVPNRSINGVGYVVATPAGDRPGFYVWTGVITVLQENNTTLGAVGMMPQMQAGQLPMAQVMPV